MCRSRRLIHFVIGAGQVGVETGENTVQLLDFGIRGGVLELLGRLRDLVLDGRAPLRRVVGNRDVVVRRVIDCRKRFVLVGGSLNGLAAGRLEADAHGGVDARIIVGQRVVAVGDWQPDFRGSSPGSRLCKSAFKGGHH